MPDYSEYILIENNIVEYRNHVRGDETFRCDIFWGEKETLRIIQNQNLAQKYKADNPFTRLIINKDTKEVLVQISIPEYENGSGILQILRYFKMLNQTWKGYKVHRIENGFDGTKKYLSEFDSRIPQPKNTYIPKYLKDLWDKPKGALVSISNNNGIQFKYKNINIAEVISKGENILSSSLTNLIPKNKIPFGGIHIDLVTNELIVWNAIESGQLDKWTSQYWKDYSIKSQENGLIQHFKIIQKKNLLKSIAAELETKIYQNLKSEILNTRGEPYSDNGHRFRPRQMLTEELEENFMKLIEHTKKDYV